MAQIDDLTAALATATSDTQKLISDVAAQVAALQAQIAALQAGGTTVDLSGVISSVNALDALVKGADPGTTATLAAAAKPAA